MGWKVNILAVITSLMFGAGMLAQTTSSAQSLPTTLPVDPLPHMKSVISIRSEAMDAAPVKGAPFCATIATEHTQNFADGNRIHTTDNSTLCRDSEGRTRRDAGLMLLGPSPQKSSAKLVTIVDPVAGYRYVLDANEKVARRMPIPTGMTGGPDGAAHLGFATKAVPGANVMYQTAGEGGQVFVRRFGQASGDEPAPATENLGDQTISGIRATGTRITTTIPAGDMGNELPIVTTSERWYSQELKATVMTKHDDPWAGELKTQFTNVSTTEPDKSLFAVPADYKIDDEKPGQFLMLPAPGGPMGPPPLPE